jgi:hypothetical protein
MTQEHLHALSGPDDQIVQPIRVEVYRRQQERLTVDGHGSVERPENQWNDVTAVRNPVRVTVGAGAGLDVGEVIDTIQVAVRSEEQPQGRRRPTEDAEDAEDPC